MAEQKQGDQLEPTFSSSVWIRAVALRTCRIGRGGERGSGIYMLVARQDDPIYPTTPLGQDMTQGEFFKRSLAGLNSEFSFS